MNWVKKNYVRQFLLKFVNIVGAPARMTWMDNIKNDDDLFHLRVFFMLFCSPKVLDTTLVETVIPIVNDSRFSFEFLRRLSEDDIAFLLEPLGLQNVRAKNLKIVINQIDAVFHGKILETVKELRSLRGVGQK